jgi:GrpB-like predicted nucleotidyltransferase (UPF0157 family)
MPDTITITAADPAWPALFAVEQARLMAALSPPLLVLEHVGSTAVPGLDAKPVIDMMAAVDTLPQVDFTALARFDYAFFPTDMPGRLLFIRPPTATNLRHHLHIVEARTWETRKERHFRDHLRQNPADAQAYGAVKRTLAALYQADRPAYTKAKTAIIQSITDRARAARGLPPEDVWKA